MKLKMKLVTPLLALKVTPMASAIAGNLYLKHNFIQIASTNLSPIDIFKKDLSFWTSGGNEGALCEAEQAFTWCSLGNRVQRSDVSLKWMDVSKQPLVTERCITLETKADGVGYGLSFSECAAATKSVLCEVNIYYSILYLFLFLCDAAHLRKCFLPSNLQRQCMKNIKLSS